MLGLNSNLNLNSNRLSGLEKEKKRNGNRKNSEPETQPKAPLAGPPSLSLSFPAGPLGLPSVHSRTGPVGSCSLSSASSLPRPSPLARRSAHASAATRARPLSNDCHLGPARQPYSSRASAVLSPLSRACVSPAAMWPPHVGALSPHNCVPRTPALCRCHA